MVWDCQAVAAGGFVGVGVPDLKQKHSLRSLHCFKVTLYNARSVSLPKGASCLQARVAAVFPMPSDCTGVGRIRCKAFTYLKTDLAKKPTKPKLKIWCSARTVPSSACANMDEEEWGGCRLDFDWKKMILSL